MHINLRHQHVDKISGIVQAARQLQWHYVKKHTVRYNEIGTPAFQFRDEKKQKK